MAGCGSTATTRAPRRRKAAIRSPTWAPTSNTRSPRCDEAAVKPIHGRRARAVAVIDAQRPDDTARGPETFEHGLPRQTGRGRGAASSMAGSAKAERAGGGLRLFGQAADPDARECVLPTEGKAVTTASGIASAGPAARNKRIGDRRRMGHGQHADRRRNRAACAATGCAAPAPAEPHDRRGSARSSRSRGRTAGRHRNMVWPNHMIGHSRIEKVIFDRRH